MGGKNFTVRKDIQVKWPTTNKTRKKCWEKFYKVSNCHAKHSTLWLPLNFYGWSLHNYPSWILTRMLHHRIQYSTIPISIPKPAARKLMIEIPVAYNSPEWRNSLNNKQKDIILKPNYRDHSFYSLVHVHKFIKTCNSNNYNLSTLRTKSLYILRQ